LKTGTKPDDEGVDDYDDEAHGNHQRNRRRELNLTTTMTMSKEMTMTTSPTEMIKKVEDGN